MEKWIFENGVKNTSVDDKALMSFWAYELSILLGMISFFDKEERQKEYHNLKDIQLYLKSKSTIYPSNYANYRF